MLFQSSMRRPLKSSKAAGSMSVELPLRLDTWVGNPRMVGFKMKSYHNTEDRLCITLSGEERLWFSSGEVETLIKRLTEASAKMPEPGVKPVKPIDPKYQGMDPDMVKQLKKMERAAKRFGIEWK